ncbi:putative small Rab GTP binding protein [Leptomonas seymouri]|uniref:Putative small Rab GTP binding protein n=1 Tax=Leptomonas seymouri TaxID=5684 RepID=A0A0N1IL60_LEPSE|nr:putative small Rab GTP binding protein [Leptomonas seymouri]|eukprot:KPI87200.1 putative small Rab GTP binding protein [Leptomonas seymouri]
MASVSRSPSAVAAKKYKLVLLGESGVGKSSVVQRLMKNNFSDNIVSTVGASFFRFTCSVDEATAVHFDIWDTAGQERFKSLASMYYRGAAAAMVVFEINVADTFEKAKFWVCELHANSPETIVILIGNKRDLESERQVSLAEAQQGAAEMNALYMETSARSGEGVQEAFEAVARKLVETNSAATVREGGVVGQPEGTLPQHRDRGCC